MPVKIKENVIISEIHFLIIFLLYCAYVSAVYDFLAITIITTISKLFGELMQNICKTRNELCYCITRADGH